MDGYQSKRTGGGMLISRKSSSIGLRDSKNQSPRICSRAGCGSNINLIVPKIGSLEKAKSSTNSVCSFASRKEVIGSSFRLSNNAKSPKNSCPMSWKKFSSHMETTNSETSSILDKPVTAKPEKKTRNGLHLKSESSFVSLSSSSSSSSSSQRLGVKKRTTRVALSNQDSPISKQSSPNTKNVASSSSSASASSSAGRKRTSEAESSMSEKGKKISGSPLNCSIPFSDSGGRVLGLGRENPVAPVTTRRAAAHVSSSQNNSSSRPGRSSSNVGSSRSPAQVEIGNHRSGMIRSGLRQYNSEGIAGVLSQISSIPQLLSLGADLFRGSLSFHDQHRDMRLDIDNMSYEQLLALEERMGTVCTGLNEEKLQKCLVRSTYYKSSKSGSKARKGGIDDSRCSICQEEYEEGEELGRLRCHHGYHVGCIQKWLRLKNWCPICKASAACSST